MTNSTLLAIFVKDTKNFEIPSETGAASFSKTVLFTENSVCTLPGNPVVIRIPPDLPQGQRRRLILEYLQNHFEAETFCVCDESSWHDLARIYDGNPFPEDILLSVSHPVSFWEKTAVRKLQKTLWKDAGSLSVRAMVFHPDFFEKVPFRLNSDGCGFDTELLLQLWKGNFSIRQFSAEAKSVFRFSDYLHFRKELWKIRFMQMELCYDFRYRLEPKQRDDGTIGQRRYIPKRSPTSVHGWILKQNWCPGTSLLDVGGGFGDAIAQPLAARGIRTSLADAVIETKIKENLRMFHVDLNLPWTESLPAEKYDAVTALDILEHLYSPESAMQQIHQRLVPGGKFYASTGNIAFFLIRILLALGKFNYGNRGILDITHHRLFTLFTFRTLIRNAGFRIEQVKGFGPPLADFFPHSPLMRMLDRFLYFFANLYPSVFAYQILLICSRQADSEDLFKKENAE